MDIGIVILCAGFAVSALLISVAYTHRLFSETRMKKRALERSLSEDQNMEIKTDELGRRLEEIRQARFGPAMHPANRGSDRMAEKIRNNR